MKTKNKTIRQPRLRADRVRALIQFFGKAMKNKRIAKRINLNTFCEPNFQNEDLPVEMFAKPECNTPACVAGWTVLHFGDKRVKQKKADCIDYVGVAYKALGIDYAAPGADDIFTGTTRFNANDPLEARDRLARLLVKNELPLYGPVAKIPAWGIGDE